MNKKFDETCHDSFIFYDKIYSSILHLQADAFPGVELELITLLLYHMLPHHPKPWGNSPVNEALDVLKLTCSSTFLIGEPLICHFALISWICPFLVLVVFNLLFGLIRIYFYNIANNWFLVDKDKLEPIFWQLHRALINTLILEFFYQCMVIF